VIVTIAAWLYILYAVLMLGSLLLGPWGFDGAEGVITLALGGLYAAMGVGLLKRLPWSRWLALGSSLLGWVLGALFLVLAIGYLLLAGAVLAMFSSGGGIFSLIGISMLFGLLLWVAGVVINFKLFWYLCSQPGCHEFGVPHGSTQTVIASCGTWIGIFILNFMASGGGQAMQAMMRADPEPAAEAQAEYEALTPEEEDYAARRARSEAMLREQAEIEAAQAAGGDAATEASEDSGSDEADDTADSAEEAGDEYTIEESPVPAAEISPAAAEEAEEDSPTRILKCVDASGGTIFTQGYCPPGSKPVRTPANP
jgi:hypothetical protein